MGFLLKYIKYPGSHYKTLWQNVHLIDWMDWVSTKFLTMIASVQLE